MSEKRDVSGRQAWCWARLADGQALSHPLTSILVGLLGVGGFAVWVSRRLEGERRTDILVYDAAIGFVFVTFVLERLQLGRALLAWRSAVDVLAVALALSRAFYEVPFISGHALFLCYALFTCRGWVARSAAGLVLLQVLYLKVVAWGDPTVYGGLLVGGALALVWRRLEASGSSVEC